MKVILVGETIPGSRTPQRKVAFEDIGCKVAMVSTTVEGARYEDRPSLIERLRYRLRIPADPAGANAGLARAAREGCDLVWVENARSIKPEALSVVKRFNPAAKLIWYSEDDTMNPRHRTVWMERCIPLYDLWVTTKSFNASPTEVPSLGAKQVLFVHNSFDPHTHRPLAISPAERAQWGADVAFVGTYETPRAESVVRLAEAGIGVRVWGNGWSALRGKHANLTIEDRPVYGDDYIRVISSSKINLCFLRKFNRDFQTCRSLEIPACGGFMLHERNPEIAGVFTEDSEAGYFGDDGDLVKECRRWLGDEAARQQVAIAGRQRAVEGKHAHADRLEFIFARLGVRP